MWHTAKKCTFFAKKRKNININIGTLEILPVEHNSLFLTQKIYNFKLFLDNFRRFLTKYPIQSRNEKLGNFCFFPRFLVIFMLKNNYYLDLHLVHKMRVFCFLKMYFSKTPLQEA